MSSFIHLIADYGHGDPAFSEVVHRLKHEDPTVSVRTTGVTPLSTVATGFWIEQFGLHHPPVDDLLIYSNTAPRTESATPDGADPGGSLRYVRLDTGVPVVAVDAGFNLAFVRDHIDELRAIDVGQTDSQFRSRDIFPKHIVRIGNGDLSAVGETLPVRSVPEKPDAVVCHVDGYGNIKTSIRASDIRGVGDEVSVTIAGTDATVTVAERVTGVPEGRVGLIPGSAGGADPYLELFLRGGSAAVVFDDPSPGDDIIVG